jgi:hypothetical protein
MKTKLPLVPLTETQRGALIRATRILWNAGLRDLARELDKLQEGSPSVPDAEEGIGSFVWNSTYPDEDT